MKYDVIFQEEKPIHNQYSLKRRFCKEARCSLHLQVMTKCPVHCKPFWLIDVNQAIIDITRKR